MNRLHRINSPFVQTSGIFGAGTICTHRLRMEAITNGTNVGVSQFPSISVTHKGSYLPYTEQKESLIHCAVITESCIFVPASKKHNTHGTRMEAIAGTNVCPHIDEAISLYESNT